jgi:hypothetical protein
MLRMIIILAGFIAMTASTTATDALGTILADAPQSSRRPIAVLCAKCDDCPVIALDETAPEAKRIVITDDFGQEIQMSVDQFQVLLELAQSGAIVL